MKVFPGRVNRGEKFSLTVGIFFFVEVVVCMCADIRTFKGKAVVIFKRLFFMCMNDFLACISLYHVPSWSFKGPEKGVLIPWNWSY